MANLNNIAKRVKESTMPIDKLCNVKKYLPIKEKFEFAEEYEKLVELHINDYPGYESFVAFVFFNLMVVKKYTNIDIECTYDEYDVLQESGIMSKIIEIIDHEYALITQFISIKPKE